jgi:hypothetical protein
MSQAEYDALPYRDAVGEHEYKKPYRVRDRELACAVYQAKPGQSPLWWHYLVEIEGVK